MMTWRICLSTGAACLLLASCSSSPPRAGADYIGPAAGSGMDQPRDSAGSGLATNNGPLEVTLTEAVLLALENNRALKTKRFEPAIRRTYEEQEKAGFKPVLVGQASRQDLKYKTQPPTVEDADSVTDTGDISIEETLSTGTKISVGGNAGILSSSQASNDFDSVRLGIGITQPLLKGGWTGPNLASLRQARTDTLISEYELRSFAEALVAQVEETYWDCALMQKQADIYVDSLKIAQDQLDQTKEMIKVGKLANIELAAAEAEVALRQEGLINARSAMETMRLRLLRLLNRQGGKAWKAGIILESKPVVPPHARMDEVEPHVDFALKMRPDLNQAKLGVKRGDLEIVKTKNGLLPRMDLFVNLGRTGYADSFSDSAGNITGDYHDISAGVQFEYPLSNADAKARHRRALLTREQALEALENIRQLVEVDVWAAHIEVSRAIEQVSATAATRKHQNDVLQAEIGKLNVGKSTTLLVAQAERNLLAARISEIQAVVSHLKALVELYRLEGSLLKRRGIEAPGAEPVE